MRVTVIVVRYIVYRTRNIITYGENIDYDKKIATIKERLAEYAREATPQVKQPTNEE